MTTQQLISYCNSCISENGYIEFTEEQFRSMDPDQVATLRQNFGERILMKLPEHEMRFFEWLKVADEAVWKDLWTDPEQPPYMVSLAFLDDFAGRNAGGSFVICELRNEDNYYFSPLTILDKESADYLAAVKDRFINRQPLSIAQALALEASIGPTDIWHFAYKYGFSVEAAKKSVKELVDDRILVHVTDADHLTQFFDVH